MDVIAAVNKFKGKWPYDDKHDLILQMGDLIYAGCGILSFPKDVSIVCSRYEFDQYIKGLSNGT